MNPHAEAHALIETYENGKLRVLLGSVHTWATNEIIRCLDPRHGTTFEQACEAVYEVEPAKSLLAYLRTAPGSRRDLAREAWESGAGITSPWTVGFDEWWEARQT